MRTPSENTVLHNDRVLFIDKPLDWTSYDVVRRVQKLFNVKKVGHAGTLDPKATGLLIICVGKKTKEIHTYLNLDKEYVGTMELGVRTPSYDSETEVIEYNDFRNVTHEQIYSIAKNFVGTQQQVPPMYSAVKIHGKPLYKYARRGKDIPRTARIVTIHAFDITGINLPYIDFRVVCSKGTYVRSLINDFGNALGCGATLRALRRTRIGSYSVDAALSVDSLEALLHQEGEQQ